MKDFLKTAETLQVRGLAESCATAVTSSATLNGGNDDDEVTQNRHSSSALRRRRIRRRERDVAGDEGVRRLESDDDDERHGIMSTPNHSVTEPKTKAVSGKYLFLISVLNLV